MTSFFEISEDILLFENVTEVTWTNSMLNGAPALVGTWAGGSITLPELSTADLANLQIHGLPDVPPTLGADGMSYWSSNSDALYYV